MFVERKMQLLYSYRAFLLSKTHFVLVSIKLFQEHNCYFLKDMLDTPVIVTDLGGYSVKIGHTADTEPRIIPNFLSKAKNERRKIFFADQLNDCKDFSGLFYVLPFQKGYLVNWDVQRQLFDYMFSKSVLKCESSESRIVISEPQMNFTSIKECMDEIMFEEYHFKSVCRKTACQLSMWKRKEEDPEKKCCLVVDSGFSFTHIVPIINGNVHKNAVKRINVGGKFLTNHLKEIVSYRQLNVLDETYVMNQVKEDCCYVASDFKNDMLMTRFKNKRNTIARDYILPDYTNVKRGYLRPIEEMWTKYKGVEQLLRLNSERFTVPELLFHPSDIGMNQMGVCEAIVDAVKATPFPAQPHFYDNILITGGNACFDGFSERVESDIRQLVPSDLQVTVTAPESPMTYAWHGGVALSKQDDFIEKFSVTKQEYDEQGKNICYQKFDSNKP